ncbi:oligosaccharide flippase family protein [Halorubrum sp. GN12_10-3_MGM]|nr:oligosaccharide flippase family protein [Halorubrum sp. GN12_10-3_MGM]
MRRDRTAVLHFLAQVVRSLAGFGTTLFAARYFGAGGLGIYSQVIALVFWLKLPSNSIKTAISKRMSESNERTGHFSAGLLVSVVYGLAVGIVVLLFDGLVNDYADANVAALLVLLVVVNITFDTVKSGFVGDKRVAVSGWLGTSEQLLRLAGQVSFAVGGAMVIGLVYGHILSLAAFSALGIILLRDRLRLPAHSDFRELRQFAQYSWLGNLEGLALNWMDVLVLGLFVANDFVGIYQASWTMASFLSLASKSIGMTLFPELSELGSEEMYGRAKSLLSDALVFAGIFLIPGLFGALVIGDRILEVYASEFAAGGLILVILIAARTCYGFGQQLLTAINGLDHPEIAFRINATFLTTNIVLNFVLVWQFGWYGAAAATLLSTVVHLVYAWLAFERLFGTIDIPVAELGYELVASGLMVGVLWLAVPRLPTTLPVTLGLVLVGAGAYGVALLGLSGRIRGKVRTVIGA